MRKLSEIVKLPVMEILNESVAGKVKDIVMNPDTKEVIMVTDEGMFSDFHILRREEVMGIGGDFIMIKTEQAIQSSRQNPKLAEMLTEYYSILGLLVVTSTGNIVSRIQDFSIDEKNWKLVEIMLEDGKVYTKDQLLSISSKYVFVQEGEVTTPNSEEAVKDGEETAQTEADIEGVTNFLAGMTVTADIANEDGTFKIEKGTILTEEIVEQAKGEGILSSLIMNVE